MPGWVAVAIAVIGAVVSYQQQKSAAKKAASARAAAARERKEAKDISEAGQENADRIARRKAIREDRVRRAKIIQADQGNLGGGGSAGRSAPGILGTNLAGAIAGQSAGAQASRGVSGALQRAADFEGQANAALAAGNRNVATTQAFVGVANTINTKTDLFKTTPPKK